VKVIIGFPDARERRSRQAIKLGLRYHIELHDYPDGSLSDLTRVFCDSISHSTVTFRGPNTTWRSLQSWGGAPYKTALFHDYGAPVLLLYCPENSQIHATFYRLDEYLLTSILDSFKVYEPLDIERGIPTIRESLAERLRRRLTVHW
jgi:hypothetical protein